MRSPSRRDALALGGLAPLMLLSPGRGWAEQPACYDPAALPMDQQGLRRSLGYTPASNDPKRHCALCAFFTGKGACGVCQILNGPVNAGAVCSSFSPKAP